MGGACITPALFVDFLTRRAEAGWSCSAVFSEERNLEAVWPVATGFHLVPRVALAMMRRTPPGELDRANRGDLSIGKVGILGFEVEIGNDSCGG